ncbi:MAG: sigma-70 family RNA polymerase sigma factor [Phycisphaeraceae bacterium]|nr:sigma-70 family RNA polymerase sigma factor [Phycisphaeraceae bacterium]
MDSRMFRQLLVGEMEAVHRMAFHLSRRAEDAAELTQETMTRALAAEKGFQLREGGIRPWLFKILHNAFYTRLGKVQRSPSLMEDLRYEAAGEELDSPAPCWDLASLDWEQVDDRLKKAIDDLPTHYREVLLLWAVEGLKYREIAEVLGVALGTVMSRLYRARTILSEQLAPLAQEHGISVET